MSDRIEEVEACEAMLVYLTSKTWASGAESIAFALQVASALEKGVRLILAHEMLGGDDDPATQRHGCEFADFFHPQARP